MRVALLVLLGGCSQIFGLSDPRLVDAMLPVDAPDALQLGPWQLDNTKIVDGEQPTALADLSQIYFTKGSRIHVFRTTGMTVVVEAVAELNSTMGTADVNPEVSANGLGIAFASDRGGNNRPVDVYAAIRQSTASAWGPPTLIPSLSVTEESDFPGCLTADGLRMIVSTSTENTQVPVGYDLYELTRSAATSDFATRVRLNAPVSSAANDFSPCLSSDGLTLYFASDRTGKFDIFVATRVSRDAAFGDPRPLDEIPITPKRDPWLSPDQRTLLFVTEGSSTPIILKATR